MFVFTDLRIFRFTELLIGSCFSFVLHSFTFHMEIWKYDILSQPGSIMAVFMVVDVTRRSAVPDDYISATPVPFWCFMLVL